MAFLEVRNLGKTYVTRLGACRVQALKDVSFSVEKGEFIAVMGESGSGKTTLLNILAALDRPGSGDVLLEGKSLSGIAEKELAAFRRDNLGFVFQDFNLLDTFSVRDNILLPLVLKRIGIKQMQERLMPVVKQLGLAELLDKYPYELSGGQKQRTAVGRAIITSPALLLADEPRGAGFPSGAAAYGAVLPSERRRADRNNGDAFGKGGKLCLKSAVFKGRTGVPSAVQGGQECV